MNFIDIWFVLTVQQQQQKKLSHSEHYIIFVLNKEKYKIE